MAAGLVQLQRVMPVVGNVIKLRVIKDGPVLQARAERRRQNLRGVLRAIHMADFATGVSWDRNLNDLATRVQELSSDVGIEIEIGRVKGKGQSAQCFDTVGTITGMTLRQPLL